MQASAPITPGTLIHNRYRLVGATGQSSSGQTYLARDLKQFNELCVLKEFIPELSESTTLELLQQFFHQEVAVLYKLDHPQIPRFRPLIAQGQRFYWVRAYIEGKSLGVLLDERKAQGQKFSEAEVIQLMAQVLPVLGYLHSQGIIHRNLSLDSIIIRQQDALPVLINFGLVRELAAHLHLHAIDPAMVRGHWGYAPPEQLQFGQSYPNSDLYSLAVSAIALLTGNRPQDLYNQNSQEIAWETSTTPVSPTLARLLERLVDPDPQKRFASAEQVFRTLEPLLTTLPAPAPATELTPDNPSDQPTDLQPAPQGRLISKKRPPQKANGDPRASLAMVAGLALLVAVVAWRVISSLRPNLLPVTTPPTQTSPVPQVSAPVAQAPGSRATPNSGTSDNQEALRDRRRKLGIDFQYFTVLVDDTFYSKNPQLRNQKLGSAAEQTRLRSQWNQIASELMDRLETLKPETRRKLGSYRRANYDQWLAQLGEPGAKSSQALDSLADQRFYQLFPALKGKTINPRTYGQIWYALAEEQVSNVKTRSPVQ